MEYYRQIRKAQKEYEKARDFVEDIVLSFNRELKREADKLEIITFKVDGSSSKADSSLKKIETSRKKNSALEEQLGAINQTVYQTHSPRTTKLTQTYLTGLTGLEIENKRH